MSKIKRPKESGSKHIKPDSAPSSVIPHEKRKPLFSFEHLQSAYCLSRCDKEEKAAFADQLRMLGSLTWAELRSAHRHGLGYEMIERSAIKAPFPRNIDDSVKFMAFRFCGKAPMVGYRINEIFHILWLDRSFTLYNHG